MTMYIPLMMLLLAVVVKGSSYVQDTLCNKPSALYEYTLSGEMHDHRGKEVAVIGCNVKLRCMSEGTYNNTKAVHYCIEMKNVIQKFFEVSINRVTFEETKYLKSATDLSIMTKKDFCFLQSKDGSLLKVLYPHNESTHIVNLKKTIVSAFQANFAKTKKKVETDSQSKHTSHYKYTSKGNNTVEHRTINSEDVSKYSGKASKKTVDYHSSEKIEVDANKIIRQVNGESTTSLTKENKKEEKVTGKNSDIPSIETKSKYTLKLIRRLPAAVAMEDEVEIEEGINEQQTTMELDEEAIKMDDMIAHYDEYEHDVESMKELHEELTDLQVVVKRMAKRSVDSDSSGDNTTDIQQHVHAIQKWRELLHLESKHGPLNEGKPKLEEIIKKLKEVWLDNSDYGSNLRMVIYDLLSSEGSPTAQQALMNVLRMKHMVESDEEYNSVITAISLLESIELASLVDFKQYVIANRTFDDELLLSLATLGRHKNVEEDVVNTITGLMEEQVGINDTETLVYFIHALGNTGSKLIIPHLLPLLLNEELQVTVINALRTVSTDTSVQMMFTDLCDDTSEASVVLAIIDSVRFPHESFLYYPDPPEQAEDEQVEKQLITSIVNATIRIQDASLYNATEMFLQETATEFTSLLLSAMKASYEFDSDNLSDGDNSTLGRSKRSYSSDWSSQRSSMYNLISSYYSRRTDKRRYPYNKAFLWATKLGQSKIHANLAVGGFAGAGGSGYKLFGKAAVKVYCFGRRYTALNGYYKMQYNVNNKAKEVRRYVQLLGRTFINRLARGTRLPYRSAWSKNLWNRRLFRFNSRVYVYVGFITFHVQGDVRIGARLTTQMNYKEAVSQVQFGPTLIITGGAFLRVPAYILGVKVRATIGYYVTPKASVTMCDRAPKADLSTCFGIFHGSNGLNVNVYAYFKRFYCYRRPWWRLHCKWSREHRVRNFSSHYRARRFRTRLLWGQCSACSCRGALHRYCSALTGRALPRSGASGCRCRSTHFQ